MAARVAKICVPVTVEHASEIASAISVASSAADIIELRLDYLHESELQQAVNDLPRLIKSTKPLILTLRPVAQGGRSTLGLAERMRFWLQVVSLTNVWFDVEFDVVEQLAADKASVDWSRIICSHHEFDCKPYALPQIYERLIATPAGIVKIAIRVEDADECLPFFQLMHSARNNKRPVIAIAMGEAGVMTRILGPSHGSFLTYGALKEETATAPGQITAPELHDLYRIDHLDEETEVFGLIGSPVSHSISPHIHNAAFAAGRLNAVYLPFEVVDVNAFIGKMAHPRSREMVWNLRGLSVTAPHKLAVIDSLDWVDATATEIGAVNTIAVRKNELHGYNTDAKGFSEPLRRRFSTLASVRCAIIGAGGAARAALWALSRDGADVTVFGRNVNRVRALAGAYKVRYQPLDDASFRDFEIVINATTLGTRGREEAETAATAEQLRGVRLAYDLVYNPVETRFIREAQSAGCDTLSGIEMLLAQAVEQFRLWTSHEASANVMRDAATRALTGQEVPRAVK